MRRPTLLALVTLLVSHIAVAQQPPAPMGAAGEFEAVRVRFPGEFVTLRAANPRARACAAWLERRAGKNTAGLVRESGYRLTNRVVVKAANMQAIARSVAMAGATWAPLPGVDGYWVLTTDSVASAVELADTLTQSEAVESAEAVIGRPKALRALPTDPLFGQQWHLNNSQQPLFDANLEPAWDLGYTGQGVLIGIVDAGVQINHIDLAANYDGAASQIFPPATISHGTSVAGIAAARGLNAVQGVGAAYLAKFSELRIGTDEEDAAALGHRNDLHDVKNNSWGPADTAIAHKLPSFVVDAVRQGALTGRGGLGTVFVWAAGNGDSQQDRVEYDPLASSRYAIAVGAITDADVKSSVSERGTSLMVVAPSNGGTRGIATTTLNNGFTLSFGGTSAAAPLASGVVALLLEARPDLTWRDVPLILAQSARKCDPAEVGWMQNEAGWWINEKYGYGAIDAGAAAALAENWTRLPHEISYDSGVIPIETALPDGVNAGITHTLDLTDAAPVMRIESVELILNASAEFLGDLSVTLTAPNGTVSNLARRRADGTRNYINYVFTTKRHIGERADGVWTVKIADGADGDPSTWHDYRLVIHGAPRCPGDLDEDGAFELDDLLLMLGGFGPCEPDAAFRPGADVDNSGCNDLADLMRVIENFGQDCP